MISKTENIFNQEYNQSNVINDTVKAMKAMQSKIRSEQ